MATVCLWWWIGSKAGWVVMTSLRSGCRNTRSEPHFGELRHAAGVRGEERAGRGLDEPGVGGGYEGDRVGGGGSGGGCRGTEPSLAQGLAPGGGRGGLGEPGHRGRGGEVLLGACAIAE